MNVVKKVRRGGPLAAIMLSALVPLFFWTADAAAQSGGCPADMIHYWQLEESASPYQDLIGAADATCTAGQCPTSIAGLVGTAQAFNGNQAVNVADDGSFDWGTGDSFSMELWMQKATTCTGTTNTYNNIMVGRYDGDPGASELNLWWLGVNCSSAEGPGKVRFVLRSDGGQGDQIISNGSVIDGIWHHIVAVRDAASNWIYLYVDGVKQSDSLNYVYSTGFAASSPLNIGYLNFGTLFHYDGDLDEVALYNRVLSPEEIADHYDLGWNEGRGYCVEGPTITSTPITTALVGELYSYVVEATGDPAPTFSLITAPDGMTIDSETGLIEWTPDAYGDYDVTVEASNDNGTDQQSFTIDVNAVPVIISLPVTSATAGALYTYDVSVTGDPAPVFSLTLFPAGMSIDEASGLIQWSPVDVGEYSVVVHAENSAGADEQSYQLVITGDLSCLTGLQHYWKLDETGDGLYEDFIGNGDAICTLCPTPATGLVDGAQDFNGMNDGMTVVDDGSMDWGADESFSIGLWMRKGTACGGTSPSDNNVLIGRVGENGSLNVWWVGVNCSGLQDQGKAKFQLASSGEDHTLVSSESVINGLWHHIVAVRDADADMNRLYVDGVPEDSVFVDYLAGFDSDTKLDIGFLDHPMGEFRYNGIIDELTTYRRALTRAEVLSLYEMGSVGLAVCDEEAMSPVITTLPVSTAVAGHEYSYDVDADGIPAPTFQLLESPTGMTINSTTGLIEWLPTGAVDEQVIVEAMNGSGTDTQEFSINVSACPGQMSHYWKLEESSGPSYQDYQSGLAATCSSCPAAVSGQVGVAQQLDGAQYMDVPDDDSYDWGASGSFTIEFWMKKESECTGTASDANNVIVGRKGATADDLSIWWIGVNCSTADGVQGAIRFVLKTSDDDGVMLFSDESVIGTGWHHIAAVRDGTLGESRLYVDGEKKSWAAWTYPTGFAASTPLNIGYINMSTLFGYDGLLDELALYDRALDDNEILGDYHKGLLGLGYCGQDVAAPTITSTPSTSIGLGQPYQYDVEASGAPEPVFSLIQAPGEMTIDEVSGLIEWTPATQGDFDVSVVAENSVAADTQSFAITVTEPSFCPDGMTHYWRLGEAVAPYDDFIAGASGQCSNCPTSVEGVAGNAIAFNGIDDEAWADYDASLDWGPNQSFSIELWLNKSSECAGTSNSENNVIVGRYGSGTDALNIWWLGINCYTADGTPGAARFVLRDEGSTGTMLLSSNSVIDGMWHHIVAVRDAAAEMNRLYVDGIEADSAAYTYTLGFGDNSKLTLGYIDFGDHFPYDGVLDELAFYDIALSDMEIESHYQLGLSGTGYCSFTCGDADGNAIVNISDAVFLIAYIFGGGATPSPVKAGDVDCNSIVNISDAVYLIAYIFGGGPVPCNGCN